MQMHIDDDIQMVYDEQQEEHVAEDFQSKGRVRHQQKYYVHWFDETKQKLHLIQIKISSDILIRDFLQIVIGEFNQLFRREDSGLFFFNNDITTYELYEPDSENKPDEEFPPYDDSQKLHQIKCLRFSLKVSQMLPPELCVSSLSDPVSCKSPLSEEEKINQIQHKTSSMSQTDLTESFAKQFEQKQKQKQQPFWFCCCQDEEEY